MTAVSRWLARFGEQLHLGLLLIVAALSAWLSVSALTPPLPLGQGAAPSSVSATRALDSLDFVLGGDGPHPVGSEENQRVRRRIEGELRRLGYEPKSQRAQSCHPGVCAIVTNIYVAIPGSDPTLGALLVSAHYDSVPAATGAADDGLGVAALLELARALKHRPALARTTLLLFSDGEEAGLLGMRAFAKHPIYEPVRIGLNVEARGNTGPSLLFQTGQGDSALVAAFAARAPKVITTSVFQSVYERMPNDTDFSVLLDSGRQGLNFALIGGMPHYHTSLDDLEHLNPRSVQHTLDNISAAVDAAQSLPDSALNDPKAPTTYFDLLGRRLVRLPSWFTAVALCLSLALLAFITVRNRQMLSARSTSLAVLLAVSAATFSALLGLGLQRLLAEAGKLPDFWVAHPKPILFACALVGLLAALALARLTRALERSLAVGLLFVALGAALAQWLPGAAYLAYIPALGISLGALLCAQAAAPDLQPDPTQSGPPSPRGLTTLWIFRGLGYAVCFLTAILWLPVLLQLYDAVGFVALAAHSGLWCVLWLCVTPQLPRISTGWLVSIGALALCAASLALLQAPYDAAVPQRASVGVVHDVDLQTTRSLLDVSHGPAPAALVREFELGDVAGPSFPWLGGFYDQTLSGPASWKSPQRSHITLVRRETDATGRRIALSWRREPWAQAVSLSFPAALSVKLRFRNGTIQGPDAEPRIVQSAAGLSAGTDARPEPPSDAWQRWMYIGDFREVLHLDLRLLDDKPVNALVCEHRFELPDEVRRKVSDARPDSAVPSQYGDNTAICRREQW